MLTPEAAALLPVVLLLIMTIFQGVAYYQAQEYAQAAAADGARAARLYDGSAAGGEQEARQLLAQTGGQWLLSGPAVTAQRTGENAQVTVDGTAPRLLPFVTLHVHRVVQGPVERFVPEAGGFVNFEALPLANRSGDST